MTPPVRTSLSDLEGPKVTLHGLSPTDGLQIVRLYLEQRAAMPESERAVILDVIRWVSMPAFVATPAREEGAQGAGMGHTSGPTPGFLPAPPLGCDQCRCEGVIECTCVCHVPDEQPGS